MDNQREKTKKFDFLRTTCNDQLPIKAKLALFTLESHQEPTIIEALILFIEYLQIAAQSVLLYASFHSYQKLDGSVITQIGKFIHTGFLFQPGTSNTGVFTAFIILMAAYTFFRYLLFGYVAFTAIRNKQPYYALIIVWRWLFRLQSRVIYCILTSFWLNTILNAVDDKYNIFGDEKNSSIIIFAFLLVAEFLFSFILNYSYRFILPRKSLFSSKDAMIESLTLIQKFMMQILQIILISSEFSNYWVYIAFNLGFSLVRIAHFYSALPNYNLHGLFSNGLLIAIIISLDISCLVQHMARSEDDQGDWTKILIVWAILSVLLGKISFGYLNWTIENLVTGKTKGSPNLLVRKISVIKQISKISCSYGTPTSFKFSHLLKATLDGSPKFKEEPKIEEKDLDLKSTKEDEKSKAIITLKQSLINELEAKISRYPRNGLLKLYLAEMYMKKLKLIGIAIKYLTELQNSHDKMIAVNASLLIWKIQNMLRTKSTVDKNEINLYSYFKTQADMVELKKKILKQHHLQSCVYDEVTNDTPNLDKILTYSQNIHRCREHIERDTNTLLSIIPDGYVEPFLFFGIYQLTLNHSVIRYLKFAKMHLQRMQKYQKEFENTKMTPENIYQDETAFVIASGQKDELGKILYCTSSITSIYGGDLSLYTHSNILTLSPLYHQEFYNLFSHQTDKTGGNGLGRVFRGLSRHREGYLIEVDYYIDVFPFLTKGFYYCIIIRPVALTRDYMLVEQGGNIEGATKPLWQKLGLDKYPSTDFMNIRMVSEDIGQANDAFNYVTLSAKFYGDMDEDRLETLVERFRKKSTKSFFKGKTYSTRSSLSPGSPYARKKSGINLEQAKEIMALYQTEGREVQLTPLAAGDNSDRSRKNKDSYLYDCKMEILPQSEELVKVVTLDEKLKINIHDKNSDPGVEEKNKIHVNGLLIRTLARHGSHLEDFAIADVEDEKASGWIDFDALGTKPYPHPMSPLSRRDEPQSPTGSPTGYDHFDGTDMNLLSPMSSVRFQAKTLTGGFDSLSSPKPRPSQFFFSNEVTNSKSKKKTDTPGERIEHPEIAEMSIMTHLSKTSHEERVSRAFNLALTTKYYSKPLTILFIVFYLLLLAVLGGQINFTRVLNNTVDDLKMKKDIITYSQNRDMNLVNTQRALRFVWDVGTGDLSLPLLNKFKFTLNTYIRSGNAAMLLLMEANQNVTLNMGAFEEEVREKMFQQDVRIYYDPNNESDYLSMTSFEATGKIIESLVIAFKYASTNLTKYKSTFDFLFRNSLNDLLIKTESDSDLFLNSIALQVEDCRTTIYTTLFSLVALLGVTLIVIIYATIVNYNQERMHLTAVTRLDNREIRNAQEKLEIFKKSLEADRLSENKGNLRILQPTKVQAKANVGRIHQSAKHIKSPKFNAIVRKYLIVIIMAIVAHVVVVLLMVINSLSVINAVQYLNTEQGKLYFTNGMVKQLHLGYLEAQEIFGSNGTSIIRNQPTTIQFQLVVDYINQLKNSAMQVFANDKGEYDPYISKVLFGHDCKFLVNSSSTNFCGFLADRAKRIGLISLLSDYEAILNQKIEQFYSSDRAHATLRTIQAQDADLMLATQRVLVDQCTMITNRTSVLFASEFDEVKNDGGQTFGILTSVLFVMAGFIWFFVFRRLRETGNTIKNVLQVFSPGLILSNFALKSFVIKTANGALDSVKNEINA